MALVLVQVKNLSSDVAKCLDQPTWSGGQARMGSGLMEWGVQG